MIKTLLICWLCIYGALVSPLESYETFDDPESDAEIIEAAVPLPGTRNLQEKRLPVLRLSIPGGYLGYVYGTRNLGERSQLPHRQALLPGIRNLDEKALPEASDFFASRHPKSEVEKVAV